MDIVTIVLIVMVFGMFYLQNEITSLKLEMEIKTDDIRELQEHVRMFDEEAESID